MEPAGAFVIRAPNPQRMHSTIASARASLSCICPDEASDQQARSEDLPKTSDIKAIRGYVSRRLLDGSTQSS
jgi:hypothetical protein